MNNPLCPFCGKSHEENACVGAVITRHESDTLQTRRRVEEYEDAKRPSTSSSLRVTHRHFHAA
jgi:hypothetical protein